MHRWRTILLAGCVAGFGSPLALGAVGGTVRGTVPGTLGGADSEPGSGTGREPKLEEDLAELQAWRARFADRGAPFLEETEAALRDRLARVSAREPESGLTPALTELVALSACCTDVERARAAGLEVGRATTRVRNVARAALATHVSASSELRARCALSAARTTGHDISERLALIDVLGRVRHEDTLAALFTCGHDPDRRVRDAASRALASWPHERVHAFLARALARWAVEPAWIDPGPPAAHLAQAWIPPESAAERALEHFLAVGLNSRDWRTTLRTLSLGRVFETPRIAPALIAALEVWCARARGDGTPTPAETGSRRIEAALTAELERRTGAHIGPHPERWRAYWEHPERQQRVRAATVSTSAQPAFWGLRPETDRVVFVIDVSGSMQGPAQPASERSRYAEAVEQLVAYLRAAGPGTRFDVLTFQRAVDAFEGHLVAATPETVEHLERWLRARRLGGGTHLEPALRRALHVGPAGSVDLAALEADTLVVLCDGETEEGPGWVAPLMADVLDATQIVIHGIQIGSRGDGTLERLAQSSGGTFLGP